MLFGLLENALGWHIVESDREKLLSRLKSRFGEPVSTSAVGFKSLLQYHLRFTMPMLPTVTHYNDLWSQHLHGSSFVGGSREYSYEAIPIMDAIAGKRITVNDRAEAGKDPNLIMSFQDGQVVHLNVLRPFFPQYYVSPTPREYVLPDGPYRYRVETSRQLAALIQAAFDDPAAPLYLGSNDGWVDVDWRVLP
jgi:CRISPR-associated protein Cas5